jgi:hypothetical protein
MASNISKIHSDKSFQDFRMMSTNNSLDIIKT